MADDDLPTRVTLVERTMVSREMLVEREEKMLVRIDDLLKRHHAQAADDQKHVLKVFGHDIAEQFRTWSDRIHNEQDERADKREEARKRELDLAAQNASAQSPIRGWIAANWMWVGGIGILVVLLRPDLATAVVRIVM